MRRPTNPCDEIACGCLAARVRVLSRVVTTVYDDAVGRHGVTIAQVNLLAALGLGGPCSPGRLGEILQLERSTVSRNLDLLLKNRWASASESDARGKREVALTTLGEKKLQAVLPDWRKAQAEAARLLGEPGVRALQEVAARVWPQAPRQRATR